MSPDNKFRTPDRFFKNREKTYALSGGAIKTSLEFILSSFSAPPSPFSGCGAGGKGRSLRRRSDILNFCQNLYNSKILFPLDKCKKSLVQIFIWGFRVNQGVCCCWRVEIGIWPEFRQFKEWKID